MPPKLDPIDIKILSALQKDALLSNTALAARVGLSPSPCLRRVNRLKKTGVIQSALTVLDARKVGFEIEAIVQVRINNHGDRETKAFEDAIRAMPEAISCFLTAGMMDYMIHTVTVDVSEHARLVKRIAGFQGVVDVQSNIVLEKPKPWSPLGLSTLL